MVDTTPEATCHSGLSTGGKEGKHIFWQKVMGCTQVRSGGHILKAGGHTKSTVSMGMHFFVSQGGWVAKITKMVGQ